MTASSNQGFRGRNGVTTFEKIFRWFRLTAFGSAEAPPLASDYRASRISPDPPLFLRLKNVLSVRAAVERRLGLPRERSLRVTPIRLVREYCGSQSSTVMHRQALLATGVLTNRLMRLTSRRMAQDPSEIVVSATKPVH